MTDLRLVDFREASGESRRRLLDIRNEHGVRSYMYSQHRISEAEHGAWIDARNSDDRTLGFIVFHRDALVGYAAIQNIDETHLRADWAFYLGAATRGSGLGREIEFRILEIAFFELNLEKLNCEVLEKNHRVIKMHEAFGFKIEGVRRGNVIMDGARCNVVLMGILREEWSARRSSLDPKV